MDYLGLGDTVDYANYNALIYLLRKFKRLNTNLTLGSLVLDSDYGTFTFDEALTSIGGNFIIENEINVTSDDVLLNCFYTFNFTAIDVNASGTVNKRIVSVTGDTGDNGELSITLPVDLIDDDEVILPTMELDIVFDEHEYFTPVTDVDVELSCNKSYIVEDETATITAVLKDDSGAVVPDTPVVFYINGDTHTVTTDNTGTAEYTITGTGEFTVLNISVYGTSLVLYDSPLIATVSDTVQFGNGSSQWLVSDGDVVVDWGDGTQDTVNNPTSRLKHSYGDSDDYTVVFLGEVTGLGNYCFAGNDSISSVIIPDSVTSLGASCFSHSTGLISVTIPESVTSIGSYCFEYCTSLTSITVPVSISDYCFWYCTSLTSVTVSEGATSLGYQSFYQCTSLTSITLPDSLTAIGRDCFSRCTSLESISIPESVTSIGNDVFYRCTSLESIILYWDSSDEIITYNSAWITSCTAFAEFSIPYTTTSLYVAKNYPSNYINERLPVDTISISSTATVLSYIDSDAATITAAATLNGSAVVGETLNYTIEDSDGTILDSGSDTTDSDGEISFTYAAANKGDITITVDFEGSVTATETLEDIYAYVTDFSDWTGSTPIYSDFNLPSSYEIIISPSTTPNFQIADSDSSGNWIWAHNIGYGSSAPKAFHYYYNGGYTITDSDMTVDASSIYKFELHSDVITVYQDDVELLSRSITSRGSSSRLIRLYDNADTIDYIKVREVHDYELTLSLSADIISSGTEAISAVLTDYGEALSGETVSCTIKDSSGSTIATVSGTTNSSGLIRFNYTSSALGILTAIVAYTDGFLTETTTFTDAEFYDPATSTDYSSWSYVSDTATFTRLTDYTYLARSGSSFAYANLAVNDEDFAVELDLQIETLDDSSLTIADFRASSSVLASWTPTELGLSEDTWYHLKFEREDTTLNVYVDDTLTSTISISTAPTIFQLNARDDNVLNFKEVVIYPV